MEIVYAAEKYSIADLLSDFVQSKVEPEDIVVSENPDETGSFYIGLEFDRFVMSPDGVIEAQNLSLFE